MDFQRVLIAAAVGVFAALVWLWAVRRWYRLSAPPPTALRTTCADGWELTVFFRGARLKRYAEPVILAHGLSVTHLNLDFEPPYSIAQVLADAGFDCYLVDWRGTGASARPPSGRRAADYCPDDHITQDAPAVLKLALESSQATSAFWVGHSLGGLVGYGLAGRAEGRALAGIVTLGSPAFFLDPTARLRRVIRWGVGLAWPGALRHQLLTLAFAPWIGRGLLPLTDTVMNPAHVEPWLQRKLAATLIAAISRKTLLQFRDWIENGSFRSLDCAVDYRAAMKDVTTPALVIAGAMDRLATPESVAAAYRHLGSRDKTLVVFGKSRGDAMDYGHGDLVFGKGAPVELYPVVQRWLEERATPVQGRAPTSQTHGDSGAGVSASTRQR